MLKKLETELENMRESHHSSWEMYGSELCAGDMYRQEDELEKKIEKLKNEEKKKENEELETKSMILDNLNSSNFEDPSQIVDD
jgi:LPS O-antigen subunit length determinant protein (WzzB/FepE family)